MSPQEFAEMAGEFSEKGADTVVLDLVCSQRGSLVGRLMDETIGIRVTELPITQEKVLVGVESAARTR